jgi:hypothetical protein
MVFKGCAGAGIAVISVNQGRISNGSVVLACPNRSTHPPYSGRITVKRETSRVSIHVLNPGLGKERLTLAISTNEATNSDGCGDPIRTE